MCSVDVEHSIAQMLDWGQCIATWIGVESSSGTYTIYYSLTHLGFEIFKCSIWGWKLELKITAKTKKKYG